MFTATELYHEASRGFVCPKCQGDLTLKTPTINRLNTIVFGNCGLCNRRVEVAPPILKKKLVYLDQWFLSNLFDSKISEEQRTFFHAIVAKLEVLVACQKVCVVVSDIHIDETSKMEIDSKRRELWAKLNSLGYGKLAYESTDVLVKQYSRLILGEKEVFPWSDILKDDPHSWIVGTQIILTRASLFKIHANYDVSVEEANKLYRKVIENQVAAVSVNLTQEECYKYICDLWTSEISEGIDYMFLNLKSKNETLTIEDYRSLSEHTGKGMYYACIRLVERNLAVHRGSLSELEVAELFKNVSCLPMMKKISCALEAQQLHRALQVKIDGNELPAKSSKFSPRYGVSSQNDTSHVSTYAPYVDILLTDNAARRKLRSEPVAQFVDGLHCTFYSDDNIQEFDRFLDELLAIDMSEDVRIAQQLFSNVYSL